MIVWKTTNLFLCVLSSAIYIIHDREIMNLCTPAPNQLVQVTSDASTFLIFSSVNCVSYAIWYDASQINDNKRSSLMASVCQPACPPFVGLQEAGASKKGFQRNSISLWNNVKCYRLNGEKEGMSRPNGRVLKYRIPRRKIWLRKFVCLSVSTSALRERTGRQN